MKRAYLLVEGQTEETFVRELLVPHYARTQVYLTPIIASTSPGHRGGVVSYAKVRPQIERLCKQDATAAVSTMFDLYALPGDFPGRCTPQWVRLHSGADKARLVEREMARDVGQPNFIPYIQLHEFEALLFVDPQYFADWVGQDIVEKLEKARKNAAPEDINDDPDTAPSRRILKAMPGYQKPVHGPLIANSIGLDAMRAACPHFAEWLGKLDALASTESNRP